MQPVYKRDNIVIIDVWFKLRDFHSSPTVISSVKSHVFIRDALDLYHKIRRLIHLVPC